MQLGMIGLGRMGANMVRRLQKNGHECVVFDMNQSNGAGTREGRADRRKFDRRFHCETEAAPRDLADGAGGSSGQHARDAQPLNSRKTTF